MEANRAQQNLNLLISSLDTILIGVAIPFAVSTLLDHPQPATILIASAFFLTLLNFFHAKFNLILVKEFEEFASEAPVWLSFINTTMHLILIGSFVFMGFFLHDPISFIIASLVMRFCDLSMDIGLLSVIHHLNLSARTRKDLTQLHINWTTGTLIFIVFYAVCLYLLITGRMNAYAFGVALMIIEILDIITDYYNNRKFYFGQNPFAKVKVLLNNNSEQFRKTVKLVSLLDEKLRAEAKEWLKDTVVSSDIPEMRDRVWYLEENSEVKGFLGTYSLPKSNALLVKYLVIKDYRAWVRYAKLLLDYSLQDAAQLGMGFHSEEHLPTGAIVDIHNLREQIPHQIREDLQQALRQVGFDALSGQKSNRWFMIAAQGLSISPELEKTILAAAAAE